MANVSPTAAATPLGGEMTFSGGGANALAGLGGSPQQALGALSGDYASAYNAALSTNQQLYSNILSGYQSTLNQQTAAEGQISQGYNSLYNNVLGSIKGISASESQNISDVYNQAQGATQAQMTNQGLGNTTVSESMQQGNLLQEQKAQVALTNQTQGLTAGYMSQLGLAGLSYANQAAMQNTAEQNQQLQFMNTVMAPYPNAGMYAQLAQGYGAMEAAQQARGLLSAPGGVSGILGAGMGALPAQTPSIQTQAGGYGGMTAAQMAALSNPAVNYGSGGGAGFFAGLGNQMYGNAIGSAVAGGAANAADANLGYGADLNLGEDDGASYGGDF